MKRKNDIIDRINSKILLAFLDGKVKCVRTLSTWVDLKIGRFSADTLAQRINYLVHGKLLEFDESRNMGLKLTTDGQAIAKTLRDI